MVSPPPRIKFGGAVHHVMARGDQREERFSGMIEIEGSFSGYLAKGGAQTGESAFLPPDGDSFSSGRHDARGQPFKVDASQRGIRNNLARRCAITPYWESCRIE